MRGLSISTLEKRVAKLDPPQEESRPKIPDAMLAESMRLIDATIPPDLEESDNPDLEWIGAFLDGDTEKMKELDRRVKA